MIEKARKFYNSKAWKDCREAYKKSVGGLCELCQKEGVIRSGEIVHHINHISPETEEDPEILLSFDNLQLLCQEHYTKQHPEIYLKTWERSGIPLRYKIDEEGRVIDRY